MRGSDCSVMTSKRAEPYDCPRIQPEDFPGSDARRGTRWNLEVSLGGGDRAGSPEKPR